MQRLWDVLLARGLDPAASGWTLLKRANAINADGSVIVGVGIHDGHSEAFLAIVPEPSAWLVLASAGLTLLLTQPRRRSTVVIG
jgi:hypothetical protein